MFAMYPEGLRCIPKFCVILYRFALTRKHRKTYITKVGGAIKFLRKEHLQPVITIDV